MGSVELNLDADAKVRDIISAEDTTSATLTLSVKQNGYDEISLVEIRKCKYSIDRKQLCCVRCHYNRD